MSRLLSCIRDIKFLNVYFHSQLNSLLDSAVICSYYQFLCFQIFFSSFVYTYIWYCVDNFFQWNFQDIFKFFTNQILSSVIFVSCRCTQLISFLKKCSRERWNVDSFSSTLLCEINLDLRKLIVDLNLIYTRVFKFVVLKQTNVCL